MEQSRPIGPVPRQYSTGQASVHVFKVCFVLVPTQVLGVLFTMTLAQAGPVPVPIPIPVPMIWTHAGPVPVPIPTVSYPYPYPYS